MSELIGVLPAAGRGSRLGPIPSSKEIMPLGFEKHDPQAGGVNGWKPFTTMESHLRGFRRAGIDRVLVILGQNKQDIMEYLGGGSRYGLHISYLFQEELRGMPFALDLAHVWAPDATTIFTMPDTLIEPDNSTQRLLQSHQHAGADLTLGLFETDNPSKFGMVELDADGRIMRFVDKPRTTDLRLMWGLAAWSPVFARFMNERLETVGDCSSETVLSDIFEMALHEGMHVQGVELSGANYNDIGTPEEFQKVVHKLAARTNNAMADAEKAAAEAGSVVPPRRLSVVRGGR